MIDIGVVRRMAETNALDWTWHIAERLIERGITKADVISALMNGEIIQQYPDARLFPKCIILGDDLSGRKLHVVCALSKYELSMVTAYYPSLWVWEPDFRTRKWK